MNLILKEKRKDVAVSDFFFFTLLSTALRIRNFVEGMKMRFEEGHMSWASRLTVYSPARSRPQCPLCSDFPICKMAFNAN